MRLSDAGLRQRQTKALYLNHRPPPWLTEDDSRDRSNRLLGIVVASVYVEGKFDPTRPQFPKGGG
jgi:hypothetical protein